MCKDVRIFVKFNYCLKLWVSYIWLVYELILMDIGGKILKRSFCVIVWKEKLDFLGDF